MDLTTKVIIGVGSAAILSTGGIITLEAQKRSSSKEQPNPVTNAPAAQTPREDSRTQSPGAAVPGIGG